MAKTERESKTILTAEDKTKSAFDSFQKSIKDSIRQSESLRASVVGIAGTAAVGAFAAMMKTAMDAADQMGKFAQKAGLTTVEMSKWAHAAKLSDVSAESLVKGFKGLSDYMVKATNATSQQAAVMRALGVDIKGGVGPALEKISETFALLPDGATKTTLAVQLFGKAGQDLIPMLNEGAAGIRRMKEEAVRLGLVITTETARASQDFNDNMKALSASSGHLGIALANDLAPQFVKITDAVKQAVMDGGKLQALWVALGGIGAFLFTDQTLSNAQRMTKEIAALRSQIELADERLKDAAGRTIGGDKLRADIIKSIEVYKQQIGVLEAQMAAEKKAIDTTRVKTAEDAKAGKVLEEKMRQLLGNREAQTALNKEYGKELSSLEAKRAAMAQELDQGRKLTEGEKLLAEIVAGKYAKYTAAQQAALKLKAQEIAQLGYELRERQALKAEIAAMAAQQEEYDDAKARALVAGDKLVQNLIDSNEQFALETKAIGKTTVERELMILAMQKERDLRDVLDTGLRASIEQQSAEREALIKNREAVEGQQISLHNTAGAWEDFADRIVHGIGNMRQALKDFLRDLAAMALRKFILNIGAMMTGNSALGAAAAQTGANTLGGVATSAVGSWLGSTAVVAWGTEFGTAAMGAFVGPAMPGSAAAFGNAIYAGFMSNPVGWAALAVIAIAAIADHFRDKENPRMQLGFGAGTRDVMANGPFGPEGFARNETSGLWDAIHTFVNSFHDFDVHLATFFTPEQMVTARSNLSTAQQREFSFPPGDLTVGQQYTMEYLKSKYGTIFDVIDHTFAEFIRTYSGSSADLATAIATYVATLDKMSGVGIKGLGIAALQAWQQPGETLAQTLVRVGTTFGQFVDSFTSDSDKLTAAQTLITTTFHDLGIAVPTSASAFLTLVQGIDVSTEAGRHLYDRLIAISPIFLGVANAASQAATAWAAFANSIISQMSSINPSLGSTFATGRANVDLSTLQSVGVFGGQNLEQAVASIRNASADQVQAVISGLAGSSQAIRDALSGLLGYVGSLNNNAAPSTNTFSNAVTYATTAVNTFADQLASARQSVDQWLSGMVLSDQLSPLTAQQKLMEAQSQYVENLMHAQSNDVTAIGDFGRYADAYLSAQKAVSGFGGDYSAIFSSVKNQGESLVRGTDVNKPLSKGDMDALKQEVLDLKTVLARLMEIGNSDNKAQTDAIVAAIASSGNRIASATDKAGALTATA